MTMPWCCTKSLNQEQKTLVSLTALNRLDNAVWLVFQGGSLSFLCLFVHWSFTFLHEQDSLFGSFHLISFSHIRVLLVSVQKVKIKIAPKNS